MECPNCGQETVRYYRDAYLIFDVDRLDGETLILKPGSDLVQTYDDVELRCTSCDTEVDLEWSDESPSKHLNF